MVRALAMRFGDPAGSRPGTTWFKFLESQPVGILKVVLLLVSLALKSPSSGVVN